MRSRPQNRMVICPLLSIVTVKEKEEQGMVHINWYMKAGLIFKIKFLLR